jgi:hypothetical protein
MRNKMLAREDSFEEKNTLEDAVWLVNVIRAIVTAFDSTVPQILSTLDSSWMALIKVHEQHCNPFGVSTKDYVNSRLPVFHAISRKINHRWISFPKFKVQKGTKEAVR